MSKKEKQLDVIFGVHSIIEAIKANRRKILTIYTTKEKPKSWLSISKIIPKYTKIVNTDKLTLNKLAGSLEHQSIVALVSQFPFKKEIFKAQKHKFIILLDNIQDPRNLGAILRSAYCIGIDGIIISNKESSPLNGTAIKASAGLAEHLLVYINNSAELTLKELKNDGYNIYLGTISGDNLMNIDFNYPICLVIGNEAIGINKKLLKYGKEVKIPQKNYDISYNASVAASILMFTIKYFKIGE